MGQKTALFLVRRAGATGAAAALVLVLAAACHQHRAPEAANRPRVDPRAYDAYYLWPGVRPPPASRPRQLYLLDGEIRAGGPSHFMRLRLGTPHLPATQLWLVVRTNRLDWDEASYAAILRDVAQWQQAGNRVAGLQVDFDAATRGIAGYRRFLEGLRRRLPQKWRLSITGLMDWSAHGDPRELAALGAVVDEVVVQTYQGRDTIPGYAAYFRQMGDFPIPFRVAIVQDGVWQPPAELTRQRQFRGYVVFLLRRH